MLHHLKRVRRHPDVDLVEVGLEVLLELCEEFPIRWRIGNVEVDAN
jgi:hypothetical protein